MCTALSVVCTHRAFRLWVRTGAFRLCVRFIYINHINQSLPLPFPLPLVRTSKTTPLVRTSKLSVCLSVCLSSCLRVGFWNGVEARRRVS